MKMQEKVSVGVSTWALITGAVGSLAAFIIGWAQTGSAPMWLAGIAAGLSAVMAWLRSWQQVNMDQNQISIEIPEGPEEDPILPDDVPAEVGLDA
jgi:hypothetical protein